MSERRSQDEVLSSFEAAREAIDAGRYIYGTTEYPERCDACWQWLLAHITTIYHLLQNVRLRRVRILITYECAESARGKEEA